MLANNANKKNAKDKRSEKCLGKIRAFGVTTQDKVQARRAITLKNLLQIYALLCTRYSRKRREGR